MAKKRTWLEKKVSTPKNYGKKTTPKKVNVPKNNGKKTNSNKLKKEAETLEKITQSSITAYMEHINISEEELKEMLNNETWLDCEEALKMGFATGIIDDKEEVVSQSVRQSLIKLIIESKCKKDDKNKKCEYDDKDDRDDDYEHKKDKDKKCEEHTKCSYFYVLKQKFEKKEADNNGDIK